MEAQGLDGANLKPASGEVYKLHELDVTMRRIRGLTKSSRQS